MFLVSFKIQHWSIFFLSIGTIGPPATVPNGNVVTSELEESRAESEPLPPGWEMRFDTYGRRYYVDHNTRYCVRNRWKTYLQFNRFNGKKKYKSTFLDRRAGSGRSPCLPVGRWDGIPGDASTTWITTRGPRRGNGRTRRGCSTTSSGRDRDSTSSNRVLLPGLIPNGVK